MADTAGNNSLSAQIEARGLRVGNLIKVADASLDTATTASTPVYSDSSSKLASGAFPFALPITAGTTDTSFSNLSFTGTSTGSAATSLTFPLVSNASASFTQVGSIRITVTDAAGNITNGQYYIPFGTLA